MPDNLIANEFSTSASMLVNSPPARLARSVTLVLCLFAAIAIFYAYMTSVDIVVTAPGRIVPSGKTVVVQSPFSGFITATNIKEGDTVKAGSPIVTISANSGSGAVLSYTTKSFLYTAMHPATPGAAHAWLDARLLESLSKLATLDAELTRRQAERDSINELITQLNESLSLVEEKHAIHEKLAKTGHMTEVNFIESKLEVINLKKEISQQLNRLRESEAALTAAIQQRVQADAEYKARYPVELVEVSRLATLLSDSKKPTNGELTITSPVDGVIHWITEPTHGSRVTTTQNLFAVVPKNAPLEVEALVFNKDIGHLRVGQSAIVKIETFDYTRYGHIDGNVQWLGADAIVDQQLGQVFATRITLNSLETPNMVNGIKGKLSPGMNVTVDVRVSTRRLLSYFIAPLLRYKEEALHER